MLLHKRVELLGKLLHLGARPELNHALEKLQPAEAAVTLEKLEEREQKVFITLLIDSPLLVPILSQLPKETLSQILLLLDKPEQIRVLAQIPPDRAVFFLQNVPEEQQQELLAELPRFKRDKLDALLHYPEESCGFRMQTEFVSVLNTATVDEAIQTIRGLGSATGIFYLYVIDDHNQLVGVLPLRPLLKEKGETKVESIMIAEPVRVRVLDPLPLAAKKVAQYNLLAIPVVDDNHHLMGVITVDDVVDIVQAEATEDMFLMAGLGKDDRLNAPVLTTVKKRLTWMLINLATAFLAASVVGFFRESIEKAVALAIFMPVVAGMGGNGGTQALTVITRSLALGEIGARDFWWAVRRQMGIGLIVGAVTGLITGLVAWPWQHNMVLGGVLWLAMMVNMMVAGLTGAMIPVVLKTLKQDPALGSGVIVTTFTDVCGFFTFLGLGTLFLKYLV